MSSNKCLTKLLQSASKCIFLKSAFGEKLLLLASGKTPTTLQIHLFSVKSLAEHLTFIKYKKFFGKIKHF